MSVRTQQIPNYQISYDMVRAAASMTVFILHFKSLLSFSVIGDIPPANYFDKTVLLLAVEFFFSLSGILLGGVLLNVLEGPERTKSLSVFLLRRVYRTFPAYYVALILFCLLYLWSGRDLPANLPAYFFFVQNLDGLHHDFFGVSWSLGVEEIFYGSFTLCLLGLTGTRFSPMMKLRLIIGFFIILSASIRFINLMDFTNWYNEISLAVLSRLDCIAIAMLVITFRDWKVPVSAYLAAAIMVFLSLVYFSLCWEYIKPSILHIIALNALYLLIPLSCAVMIQYWAQNIKIRSSRIIVFCADISYPLYVFHMIGFYFLISFEKVIPLYAVLSVMGLCVIFSYLFHRYIEQPVLAMRPSYSQKHIKSIAEE